MLPGTGIGAAAVPRPVGRGRHMPHASLLSVSGGYATVGQGAQGSAEVFEVAGRVTPGRCDGTRLSSDHPIHHERWVEFIRSALFLRLELTLSIAFELDRAKPVAIGTLRSGGAQIHEGGALFAGDATDQ